MASFISLNEMRERVGPVLFGDDWIGEATDEDWSLIAITGLKSATGKALMGGSRHR